MECGMALTEAGSICACGYHLKPEAKFCPECGKPAASNGDITALTRDEDSDPLICPVCNSIQDDENWRFCGICGEKKEVLVSKPAVTQNHPRYAKLGHGGLELADDATQEQGWMMTRDKHTGLIWEIKTEANKDETYTWDEAQTVFIKKINEQCFGGFNDWRMPEKEELKTLIKEEASPIIDANWFPFKESPIIDADWFPFTGSDNYWSASTRASSTNVAWVVRFNNGQVNFYNRTSSYHARAVRTVQ